jgi:hypothetical protein
MDTHTIMMNMRQKSTVIAYSIFALVIILVVIAIFAFKHKTATTRTAGATTTGCRAQTFTTGSSGACVKDIQTMTNYMETAALTECPFTGGQTLPISGDYDSTTAAQVKVVQTWASCYYRQEGMSLAIASNGIVDNNTWTELCDFAYSSPKNSHASTSPYTQASIAAGKNAHC